MRTMRLLAVTAGCLGLLCVSAAAGEKPKTEKVNGYAEWRHGDRLVVDGQVLTTAAETKFKGREQATSFVTIPLGYEVKAKGLRQDDGSLLALEVEAKSNGMAALEKDALGVANAMEQYYRSTGRLLAQQGGGRLRDHGRDVQRVRTIARRLIPPYRDFGDFRVYVADVSQWNAFACANGMIVVYTGLLEDCDDDEVALVLAHELAHATHEHLRRQMKKSMLVNLAGSVAVTAARELKDDRLRRLAQGATQLGALAWNNGYSRDFEYQADRVGMRYAYEGGFDVRKCAPLWERIAAQHGQSPTVRNFFLGTHPLPLDRAKSARRQVALNYSDIETRTARKRR